MRIEERHDGEVTILDLRGKFILGEGDELLKSRVDEHLGLGRKNLLLNLSDVPYIDSVGLAEIVRTYTAVSRAGGRMKIATPSKRVQNLLTITKLASVFEVFDDPGRAVASFT